LQVESFFPVRSRFAVLVLCTGALLAPVAGCHRSPAPDVMATVNGKEIMRSDLEKYYKASLGDNPQQPTQEEADLKRLSLLRGLIDDEIIQQRATKFNLAASDEDVDAKIREMKALDTQEEFEKHLKDKGITLDDLKRDLRRNLTGTKLLNKEIESKINITDADIGNFYNANKALFNVIEPRYNIAQIVVTTAPSQQAANLQNNKASGDADARKKIQDLHTKLESGEEFGALAMSYSEDKDTASNGGDIGPVYESQLHTSPEVYSAISKLKPGQITDVIPKTEVNGSAHRVVGYALYKLISREAAGQRSLNDPNVQQYIRQQLHESHAQLLRGAYFEMVRDEAKVHNYFAESILKQGAQ